MVKKLNGFYVSSKVLYADMWKRYRDELKYPIISTWIDEGEVGATDDWNELN